MLAPFRNSTRWRGGGRLSLPNGSEPCRRRALPARSPVCAASWTSAQPAGVAPSAGRWSCDVGMYVRKVSDRFSGWRNLPGCCQGLTPVPARWSAWCRPRVPSVGRTTNLVAVLGQGGLYHGQFPTLVDVIGLAGSPGGPGEQHMSDRKPLMPKATAVWLVENTSLAFEQIAEFCGDRKSVV